MDKSKLKVTLDPANGTAYVRGIEGEVTELKKTVAEKKVLEEKEAELKGDVRMVAEEVSFQAEGIKSVLFVSGDADEYVTVSMPDLAAESARLSLDAKKTKTLVSAGGIEATGLSPEQAFEDVPGPGPTVVLSGRWVDWFFKHLGEHARDEDIKVTEQGKGTRRLRADAAKYLQQVARADDEKGQAARKILLTLLRSATVRMS